VSRVKRQSAKIVGNFAKKGIATVLLEIRGSTQSLKLRSHTTKSLKALPAHYSLFHCIAHTALKRINDIVTITAAIVFLAVNAIILMISLCMIAA